VLDHGRGKEEAMDRYRSFLAGCALFAISGAAAHADCAEDLAALTGEAGTAEGISKDGSLAPLQDSGTPDPAAAAGGAPAQGAEGAAEAEAGGEGISKDGSLSPLQGAGTAVATSQEDAQAQQQGEPTAAQQAESGSEGSPRSLAIERAQAALAAGDEAACNAALEEARSL
jgi:hypothetical protein